MFWEVIGEELGHVQYRASNASMQKCDKLVGEEGKNGKGEIEDDMEENS